MANETLISKIKKCIEQALDNGEKEFIIYPFGDVGMQVKNILYDSYNLTPSFILDNHLYKYNTEIKPLSYIKNLPHLNDYCVVLASTNPQIYNELKEAILEYIIPNKCYEFYTLPPNRQWKTELGKYSFGPIAQNHGLIEKIGNFCSFAYGVAVVPNHVMSCITTSPICYAGQGHDGIQFEYETYKDAPWYFKGIQPHPTNYVRKRITIGNDVWLGRNVIITNGANIGNGVIAGAGAIITKDVPDYAIVVGAPARIIKYRYTPAQIEALNTIQWWNWTDDEIRERYDDLYLPIEEFIQKYL